MKRTVACIGAAAVALVLLAAVPALAQGIDEARARTQSAATRTLQINLDRTIDNTASLERIAPRTSVRQTPGSRAPRRRSVGRAILGGAVGAVGGFFAGGYLGAMLEPDCNCDDPGLKGALIGAPVGAVVGGILGAKFLF
jgi:hypothetical protein